MKEKRDNQLVNHPLKNIAELLPAMCKEAIVGEKNFIGTVTKEIERGRVGAEACCSLEDEIIAAMQKELDGEGKTFKEKKYCYDQIIEATKRKEQKDSEAKEYVLYLMKCGCEMLLGGIFITASLYLKYQLPDVT